jgi:DNA polymerase III delta prime subunit
MVEGTFQALKVEIDNVKEGIKSNREEIKEDIKEIKLELKETKEYYRDVLDELKENAIKTTEILHHQTQQQEVQFAQVKSEISDLNNKIDENISKQKIDIIGILKFIGVGIGGLIIGYLGMKLGLK